jgi:hypothetical protein
VPSTIFLAGPALTFPLICESTAMAGNDFAEQNSGNVPNSKKRLIEIQYQRQICIFCSFSLYDPGV